ncbi:hypothetical protein B0H66DRAFT_535981 [Apodospora peruviana]|uniref:GPI inositol-deacylase winged helix domain-containing protein n=1 Tax=Apodospora peruviana TaxID=516989 RepID=A0AAE0M135_9PEZI|nr:hypothetical protein B0H66DRAFT_535981 [Apodospora peruviana]
MRGLRDGLMTKVMDSTPSNMDALYSKILTDMGCARFGKDTAKAFIAWTTYAFHPLSTFEIQEPIEMDINDKIDDVKRTISKSCGSLVFVDKHKRVQLVHLTAREFLTRKGTASEFTVTKAEGHRRLAAVSVCLRFLTQSQSKHPGKGQRLGSDTDVNRASSPRSRSPSPVPGTASALQQQPMAVQANHFTDYASKHLFQHIVQVPSTDIKILVMLSDFLGSNFLLQWIGYIATHGDLRTLYSAGKIINSVLSQRAQHSPPVGLAPRDDKLALLDRWGDDLIHLATKFSRWLRQSPTSIHHLIPPFCPSNSVIRRQFSNQYRGLSVQGLSVREWDDCLTTITYPTGTKPNAVAAGPGYFAVGMMNSQGSLIMYDDSIFQEINTEASEPVWRLAFAESGRLLASADGTQQASFKIPSLCLSLAFGDADTILRVALRQNQLAEWDVEDNAFYRDEFVTWTTDLGETMQFSTPILACIRSAVNLLAVLYRGENIVLWDCIEDCIYDLYEKDTGSVQMYGSHKIAEGATTRRARDEAVRRDVLGRRSRGVRHGDGEPTATVVGANTMVLATSHDGRTLAGVDSHGNLTLFEFETLRPLYRVRFNTQTLPKGLAFTANSLRFIEVRGNQCRVWEPTVLLRSDTAADDGENSDTVSVSVGLQEIDYQTARQLAPDITAITCCRGSSVVFCGTEDGQVHVYDIAGGQKPQGQLLFVQSVGCTVHLVHIDEASSVLACGDSSEQWTVDAGLGVGEAGAPSDVHREAGHALSDAETGRRCLDHADPGGLFEQPEVDGSSQRGVSDDGREDWACQWSLQVIDLGARPFGSCAAAGNGNHNTNIIRLWDFGALEEKAARPLSPLTHELDTLSSRIDAIIGTFGTRIVLYTAEHWIASVELSSVADRPSFPGHMQSASSLPAGNSSFVRHFFLPNNWIGSNATSTGKRLICGLGRAGEVLLAKRSELAVVTRGLEVTGSGASFNPRRGATRAGEAVAGSPLGIVERRRARVLVQ